MKDAIELAAGIVVVAAWFSFWSLTFRKAGYGRRSSALMAIGLIVPFVNLGILIYFASATWPIQLELASFRAKAGVGGERDAQALISAAFRLESDGNVDAAIAAYQEVIRRFPNTDFAKDSEISIRTLREKVG